MADEQGLTEDQILHTLRKNPGWKVSSGRLQKTFEFDSFDNSIKFVVRAASVAERLGHHPDIDIRYNKVALTLQSHDVGQITDRDLELAKAIEENIYD